VRQVAVYARISSDPQGTRLGVDRQVEDCERLAASLGLGVHDLYVDNDTSAWSGRSRPEYQRLCEDIKAGVVGGVVVWHMDRLHRHPKELEDFITLIEAAGAVVRTVTAGDVDLSDSTGRAVARILGAVARKESDDKSARLVRKHLELATKGQVSGGGERPYGFERNRREVVAEEAAHLREAARRVIAGESVRSVCADFNARGITTSTGGAWSGQTMRRVLRSARISGRRERHGEIVAKAEWPGIISPNDSDRLRTLLGSPAGAAPSGRAPRRYLLAGLLRCGLCHSPLVSRPRPGGIRRYVCASGPGFGGCGRMAVMSEPVEAFVAQAVLYRLDTPDLARALADARKANAEHDTLATRIADDQEMLDTLASDYAAKTISHREWLTARQPIQARIDATKRRLSRVSGSHRIDEFVGRATALAGTWADLPLTRQVAIVRTLIDHIVVQPAFKGRNRFDPERLIPIWRL
jgi:site-specific DNA recombinase